MAASLKTAQEIDEKNAENVDDAEILQMDIDNALDAAQKKLDAMGDDHNSIDNRAKEVIFDFMMSIFGSMTS